MFIVSTGTLKGWQRKDMLFCVKLDLKGDKTIKIEEVFPAEDKFVALLKFLWTGVGLIYHLLYDCLCYDYLQRHEVWDKILVAFSSSKKNIARRELARFGKLHGEIHAMPGRAGSGPAMPDMGGARLSQADEIFRTLPPFFLPLVHYPFSASILYIPRRSVISMIW